MEKMCSSLDSISEEEKTPLVKWLLEIIARLESENKILKEEINSIKKLKNKPDIKPSTLNDPDKKKKTRIIPQINVQEVIRPLKKIHLYQMKKLYFIQKKSQ